MNAAVFVGATFVGRAECQDATVDGCTRFENLTFAGSVDEAHFGRGLTFEATTFCGSAMPNW
ncbi:hypothetical protein [Amycolatopsis kentuckyensis]|uniref:hypothetical protein n=1 Tax=Amycolatopsis kentuckyensis TaxID=218823 RepID=UPI003561E7C6